MRDWTTGPKHLGSGWISGVLSAGLGVMGLGGVLCLLYPQWLTTPEFREFYDMRVIRGLIQFVLIAAFVFGFLSIVLRKNKVLAITGLGFTTVAVLLGGSEVPVSAPFRGRTILDWTGSCSTCSCCRCCSCRWKCCSRACNTAFSVPAGASTWRISS